MEPNLMLMILILTPLVSCYKSGPPVTSHPSICTTMKPLHDEDPQTSVAPYDLITDSDCFKEKGLVTVTINATDEYYEGFFVMAKPLDKDDSAYGEFIVDSSDEDALQTLKCFEKISSAVGHRAAKHYYSHTFTWHAPESLTSDIHLVATIVHEKEKFWMNIERKMVYNESCAILTHDDYATESGTRSSLSLLIIFSTLFISLFL